MHELGIMTGVVDSVTQAAQANGALKVLKVSLSVGRMTEAIEDALQFAFEALTDRDPLYEGARLEIAMVEPRSRCTECGTVYEHDRFHVSCPECGGFGELISGKELRIDSIEVDLPDGDDPDDGEGADGPDGSGGGVGGPDGSGGSDEGSDAAQGDVASA